MKWRRQLEDKRRQLGDRLRIPALDGAVFEVTEISAGGWIGITTVLPDGTNLTLHGINEALIRPADRGSK